MRLKEIMSVDSIMVHVNAADQLDAIGKLVALQEKNGTLTELGVYRSAIYAREDITSTALDGGIAIPHAKSQAVTRPCVAFLTLNRGVDWGAYDHSMSDLLFLVGAPMQGNEHLRLLTYLTTLLNEIPSLANDLRAAATADEVLTILERAEETCFGPTKAEA